MRRPRFRKFFFSSVFIIVVVFVTSFSSDFRITNLLFNQLKQQHQKTFEPFNFTSLIRRRSGPNRLVYEIDCQRIIEGENQYISAANDTMIKMKYKYPTDRQIGDLAQNCTKFTDIYSYKDFFTTQEELDFPIAYTILTYKDAIQTEKLLNAIYRPHNVYCIHVDKVSIADSFLLYAMTSIANCLPNVFIASKLEDVIYAGFSRLKADLNCMSDLLNKTEIKWRYAINLPSQEYPLKTNAEIVKILQIYNGTSSIDSVHDDKMYYRCNESYIVKDQKVEASGKKKDPPPYNITVGKGIAYGVFSWSFVNYLINDVKAQDFLKWLEDTYSPDEFFWATLASNEHLHVPGVLGYPDRKLWIASSTMWHQDSEDCQGKFFHDVCVFGLGDLNRLVTEKELFANKFFHDYQPLALQCMEEWYLNKSFSPLPFETYHYRKLINSRNIK